MKKKYKLLIIGHMRHGKDTVAGMIEEFTGMSFKSSSEMAAEIFIYDKLKDEYGYSTFIECFEDRMAHRAEWHDLICEYNMPDKARLAKEILEYNDMYVGMRSQDEIQKCIDDKVFDMIIGVYDENKPLEPKDSFNIDLFSSSDIIIPTGDLNLVKLKVKKICDLLLNQDSDRPKKFLKFPKIGLDVDGVLADFTGAWANLYSDVNATPSSWYFDRKIVERFEAMRENNTLDDFYLNIEPLIGESELPFEPHCYITSRPVSKEITEAWLDKHNFPRKPVISLDIKTSKVDAAKKAGVEIFIDDSFENFVDLNNNNIFTYLFTAPWNIKYDVGHMRLNSLKDMSLLK